LLLHAQIAIYTIQADAQAHHIQLKLFMPVNGRSVGDMFDKWVTDTFFEFLHSPLKKGLPGTL